MEVYEIKALDCTFEKNRKRLTNATKKVLKRNKFPNRKILEAYIKKLEEDHGFKVVQLIQRRDGRLFVSMEIRQGVYTTFDVRYYYEALCKVILIAHEYIKYYRRAGK